MEKFSFINLKQKILELMLKVGALIFLFVFVQCTNVSGTIYYVSSSTGNDSANGKTEATAWKTIAKVNSKFFLPGDSVLFKRGDTWRETLKIPSSGSSLKYIYFGSYGTGSEKPLILGSDQANDWEYQGRNIWKSSTELTNPYAYSYTSAEIFFVNSAGLVEWGIHASDTASLSKEYNWTWIDSHIFVFCQDNPSELYESVEVPQRDEVINIGGTNQYIEINGLDLRFAKSRTVNDDDPEKVLCGFILSNCRLSYVGSRIKTLGYNCSVCRSNMTIKDNEIFEGGRRGISIHVYDADNLSFSDINIIGNTCHDGYHGTGVGIAMDGSRYGNKFSKVLISGNLFYDPAERDIYEEEIDPSAFISVRAGEKNSSITDVKVVNNIFKYPTNHCLELLNVQETRVFNNTFYDFNHNIPSPGQVYQIDISNGCKDVDIINNIFYGTGNYDFVTTNRCIFIESTQSVSEIAIDYNLFYQKDPRYGLIVIQGNPYIYYRAEGEKSWSEVDEDRGWQIHDPGLKNPLFVNEPEDLHLAENSPAIGAGACVYIDKDYDGKFFNKKPSIGAYEGNPSDVSTIPAEASFLIYPNPSNGDVTVSRAGMSLDPQALRIMDMTGRVLFNDNLEYGVDSKSYSLGLDTGVYVVQLINGKTTKASQKMVIVR